MPEEDRIIPQLEVCVKQLSGLKTSKFKNLVFYASVTVGVDSEPKETRKSEADGAGSAHWNQSLFFNDAIEGSAIDFAIFRIRHLSKLRRPELVGKAKRPLKELIMSEEDVIMPIQPASNPRDSNKDLSVVLSFHIHNDIQTAMPQTVRQTARDPFY
ncbi:hypothetical protein M422DRAFT_56986 [Sphaerobolus stellatus SS14]|uniref:C2 domain-containing protein n=1 Tax=Sphaerobolus stellatus (strain SS14) TaxID=990650 RepID=A0A0C9TME5_SPHS4|nr:hypothetical protein M422DRAFT_56986 [Sphaerobolus stellatus SS14]